VVAASHADRGRDGRAEPFPVLAVILALAAGAVDAACFARLGEVFAGVMTGNLTLLGLAVARPSATIAVNVAVALLGYVAGTAVGTVVASRVGSTARPWAAPIFSVLLVELTVLAVLTIGWVLAGGRPVGTAQLGLLAVAAMAMGLQAAAMRSVGTRLSTTFLTGTLTAAVAGLLTGGEARSRSWWSLAILVAHTAGAALAAGVLVLAPSWLPAVPDAAVLGVVVALGLRERRSRPRGR
jgi:uncharacterized membrane protein YoaK (UPF0700 family)